MAPTKSSILKSFQAPATTLLPRGDDGESVKQHRAPGAQARNTNAKKHGLFTLQRRLRGAGLHKNDGRSAIERLKVDWKADVRSARGGELSPQQETLLEAAACTWLMLSSVDAWLLDQSSLVNRRRRELVPVVQQRAALVRSLRDLLGDVGLERIPTRVPTLEDIQREYAERHAREAEDDEPPPD